MASQPFESFHPQNTQTVEVSWLVVGQRDIEDTADNEVPEVNGQQGCNTEAQQAEEVQHTPHRTEEGLDRAMFRPTQLAHVVGGGNKIFNHLLNCALPYMPPASLHAAHFERPLGTPHPAIQPHPVAQCDVDHGTAPHSCRPQMN
eukprot:CAMPEP_0183372644 /NCGR_PEP_ID=MMETSP0164_2-20130417/109068_1 /TAXON_ID=221442 /ORGANISM="Coccolithus pelagicus ssp braarudi, Strain PLY182g" /LENGTH=144 /DNA_ID=CAMNT_0025549385 /DNA_START=688 /DNA_END=1120 /DNA_ORIENTATION=-